VDLPAPDQSSSLALSSAERVLVLVQQHPVQTGFPLLALLWLIFRYYVLGKEIWEAVKHLGELLKLILWCRCRRKTQTQIQAPIIARWVLLLSYDLEVQVRHDRAVKDRWFAWGATRTQIVNPERPSPWAVPGIYTWSDWNRWRARLQGHPWNRSKRAREELNPELVREELWSEGLRRKKKHDTARRRRPE